jgi:hypothetical protein
MRNRNSSYQQENKRMQRISRLANVVLAAVLAGGVAACDNDPSSPPLTPPANLAVAYNGTAAVVTFDAVSRAESYTIQRQNVTAGTSVTYAGVTATTYSDTVTPGFTYSYSVASARGGDVSSASAPFILAVGLKRTNLTNVARDGVRNLSKDTLYVISGPVTVDSGAVLNIPAGTKLVGDTLAGVSYLVIRRGGRIVANGTAAEPIVFTSMREPGKRRRGDWGGVVINGRSNCNFPQPCSGEGSSGTYGGNVANDNSGTLRYVRIEYAGYEVSPNNELNGLTLNGVGSGTTIEYVQVHFGLDDGIEWFGGTVNVRYALVTGQDDDAFDYSTGWAGKGQFWIAQADTLLGDKGFEVDNNETTFDAQPWTDPSIYNVTLVGRNGRGAAGKSPVGMHLRRGARGDVFNALVTGYTYAIDIDDALTATHCGLGELRLANSLASNMTALDDPDADAHEATCRASAGWSLAQVADVQLTNPFNLDSPSFVPAAGSPALAAGAAATPPNDGFFTPANYIGAVAGSGTPWYAGWTTFARN